MFSSKQISALLGIAKVAGIEIMNYYNDNSKDIDFIKKDDNSDLTAADIAANKYIVENLSRSFPEIAIVSEENSKEDNQKAAQCQEFFMIDPLDGTSSFIKRSNEFTVNIALIKNHIAIFGLIYVPAMDLMYYTDQNNRSIKVEKFSSSDAKSSFIKTSKRTSGIIVVCTKRNPERLNVIKDIKSSGTSIKEVVSVSSSYKFCMVAEGLADLYPRMANVKGWDIAAGHAILKGSGGNVVRYYDNKELEYSSDNEFEMDFFKAKALKKDN